MATRSSDDRLVKDADRRATFVKREPVNVAAPGHVITVNWNGVAGATAAEVTAAGLTLSPAVAEETFTNATMRADNLGWSIDVPANKRVRGIGLVGLKQPGGSTLTDAPPNDMRLTVSFPQVQGSEFDTPRFSVPRVARDNAVPPTLTGATFSGGVLRLTPATAAARVRVALVNGANPSEFSDQATELTQVNLTTHATARNATVTAPDGTVVWAVPEFDPDAEPADVDLRHVLETALTGQVGNAGPLQAAFTVSADAPALAFVDFDGASGFLLRVEPGVIRTVLAGDPATPPFADFAAELPHSATGDLTVRYDGMRILETVSDPVPGDVPESSAPVSGVIVGTSDAVRAFAPLALEGRRPARIGIFGRAPEACELAIEFVQTTGQVAGPALAPPAVVAVEAGGEVQTHWAELPGDIVLEGASGIRVRANSGRFFWAFNPAGEPMVRLAIFDPDPGGRPLFLGSAQLVAVTAADSHQPAFSFPASVLRGPVPPLHSDLFLTVDISDLTVRYSR